MRLLLAWIALFGAACAPSPEPASPPSPTHAAPRGEPAQAASAAAPVEPLADQGAPGEALLAMRWTLEMPSVGGRPWSTQRLIVTAESDATWTSEGGEGDADVNEDLSPRSTGPSATPKVACRGHLGPDLHKKLVGAARRAMASGCKPAARPVDAATTTIAVTLEGGVKSCSLARSGGSYVAFEQARSEVVSVLCQRP